MTSIEYFIKAFSSLHVDKSKGIAPHKPILLLSIIHEYEKSRILDNRIFITPELTHTFSQIWNKLVTTDHDKRFALPFYHLKGEKGNWWKIIPNPSCEIWIENAGSMRSFSNLNSAIAYVEIDQNLAQLFLKEDGRKALNEVLISTYFPNSKSKTIDYQDDKYIENLKNEILEESPVEYKKLIQNLKKELDLETYQIEIYSRDVAFRREILKLYNETCCISKQNVVANFTISMVDACHIVPFAESFNNNPANGIALSPNLHRAFDRGLLSIDANYKVVLSKHFSENRESPFSFQQFESVQILLPTSEKFLPSQEAFAWHRKNKFKK